MNMIGCGCGQQPVMRTYPFTRGALHQCDCCTQMHQPNTAQYPISGSMQENAYMLINSVPYLLDNSTTSYGVKISVSENIYTKFSKSNDQSCINLTAAVDMTGDIITNAALMSFIESVISSQFETLENVLPIQKSSVTFRFYFSLRDMYGGVAYQSHVDSICPNHLFHYTDIQDFFVTSFKNVAVTNIPQLDYAGVYQLSIDRVEAYTHIVDTKAHATAEMNPYYQWIENNTKVVVQHDTVQGTTPDTQILIGSVNINYSIAVQLNLTTRLRIAFTVYLSNTIKAADSYGIYKALFNPTEHIVAVLMQRINALETRVDEMQMKLNTVYPSMNIEYAKDTEIRKGAFTWITPGTVYQSLATYTTTNSDQVTVEEALAQDVLDGKLIPVIGQE